MREIDRLRKRMKNIDRNVIEYRMTISEARSLIQEFDDLEKKINEKISEVEPKKEETNYAAIWDGGSFE